MAVLHGYMFCDFGFTNKGDGVHPGWTAGDVIVITTTDYNATFTEQRVISSVVNRTITLSEPLSWSHFGAREVHSHPTLKNNFVFDMFAEVGPPCCGSPSGSTCKPWPTVHAAVYTQCAVLSCQMCPSDFHAMARGSNTQHSTAWLRRIGVLLV
jgi:hypothetical protein